MGKHSRNFWQGYGHKQTLVLINDGRAILSRPKKLVRKVARKASVSAFPLLVSAFAATVSLTVVTLTGPQVADADPEPPYATGAQFPVPVLPTTTPNPQTTQPVEPTTTTPTPTQPIPSPQPEDQKPSQTTTARPDRPTRLDTSMESTGSSVLCKGLGIKLVALNACNQILINVPGIDKVLGYGLRPENPTSCHPIGLAIDLMVSSNSEGDKVASCTCSQRWVTCNDYLVGSTRPFRPRTC